MMSNVSLAQGPLDPPGPPAASMKTLAQVEARTIVNAANTPGDGTNTFIINTPGSYYLASNLTGTFGKHGISIQASDVTLDLNGFVLTSGGTGAGPVRGIDVPAARSNLCVRNGTIRGWNDGGVRADLATNTLAETLRLSDNLGATGLALGVGLARGCVATNNGTGFAVGLGGEIRDCVATANVTGFQTADRALLSSCVATANTGVGFDCTNYVSLTDCNASRNFGVAGIRVQGNSSVLRCNSSRNIVSASGIVAGLGCTIVECTACENGVHGIIVGVGCTVQCCTARANVTSGITTSNNLADSYCQIIGNTCNGNFSGILANGNKNRVEGNCCTANTGTGLATQGLNNFAVRNTAGDNLTDFNFFTLNVHGPIVDMRNGFPITEMSPWANFIY